MPTRVVQKEHRVGWQEKAETREEARATTDEGVDAEASQKGKRMVSGSVSVGGIWVTTSPSQAGSVGYNDVVTLASKATGLRLQPRAGLSPKT